MFRIVMFALWSRDFLAPLTRVLEKAYGCDYAVARRHVQEIAGHKTLVIMADTPGKAFGLASRLMHYGVYTQVDQLEAISDAAQIRDALAALPDKTSGWYVLREGQGGSVQRIVEEGSLVSLDYERECVREEVGKEMLKRSAREIDTAIMEELERRIAEERPRVEAREMKQMAQRRRRRVARNETSDLGLAGQEEE